MLKPYFSSLFRCILCLAGLVSLSAVWLCAPQALAQTSRFVLFGPGADTLQAGQFEAPTNDRWIAVFDDVPAKASEAPFDRFRSDLAEVMRRSGMAAPLKGADYHERTFSRLLSGMSFVAPATVVPDLLRLPYVKAVFPDLQVRTTIPGDVYAASAWHRNSIPAEAGATSSASAAGPTPALQPRLDGVVTIAVVDTGIDYNHPDLGGGFGPGFRVKGGRDLVDEDADPMDEHGHGTHVAGIAAGAGLSAGMAPQAHLLAYRVLDAYGSGSTSAVISAIEEAVAAGADVINLSLGTSAGGPDHPLSLAVDEAVRAGVLVVVAAGNTGPTNGTVGTPASARLGLAVAAADAQGRVATFSSRGPVAGTYGLKPDIAAPGVDIRSAFPGGGYRVLSGTSMATPYVAGMAARLLEADPELPALALRSRLVQSAAPADGQLWDFGQGSADLARAQALQVAAHPSSISIPTATQDPATGTIVHRDTLWLYNRSDIPRHFSVLPQPPPNTSVDVLWTGPVMVPEHSSIAVPIRIVTDYRGLPYAPNFPPVYLGRILAVSDTDTLALPVGLAKASRLTLSFDAAPDFVLIHDRNLDYRVRPSPGQQFSLELASKTYDVIAIRNADQTKWIREGVQVEGVVSLSFSGPDAENEVGFHLRDPQGEPIGACLQSREWIRHEASRLALEYQYEKPCPLLPDQSLRFRFTDLSSAYRYEVTHLSYGENTGYEYLRFPFAIDGGIHGDMALQKGGDDFLPLAWEYKAPPQARAISFIRFFESNSGNRFQPPSWQRKQITAPWVRHEWLMPNPSADYSVNGRVFDEAHVLESSEYRPEEDTEFSVGPVFRSHRPDSIEFHTVGFPGDVLRLPFPATPVPLGAGLQSWHPGLMRLQGGTLTLPASNIWLRGWSRELTPSPVDVWVHHGDGTAEPVRSRIGHPKQASLDNPDGFSTVLGTGHALLELAAENRHLGNRRVRTTVRLRLNTGHPADTLACVDRWAVVDGQGHPVDQWASGESRTLVIDAGACAVTPRVQISHESGEIRGIAATAATFLGRNGFRVELPADLPDGLWDIRLSMGEESGAGPFQEIVVAPAFRVGEADPAHEPPDSPSPLAPAARSFVTASPVLLAYSEVPFAAQYRVQLAADAHFGDIVADTVTTHMQVEVPVDGYGKTWYWRVQAANANGTGPWSLRQSFTSVVNTASEDEPTKPTAYFLDQNYPNPFNPSTRIRFGLERQEEAVLEIYTVTGQLVRRIDLGLRSPGVHEITVDMGNLAGGLYIYRMRSPSFQSVRRMTYIK